MMRLIRFVDALPSVLVAVCLFLLCFLSIYPVHRLGLPNGDLAEYLNNATRVLQGELPYRDFWLLFSPLEVLVPAWLYALGGVNIAHILTANLVVNALAAVAAFAVARQIVSRNSLATLAALLVFYLGPPRFTPCFVYPQHCLLFSLLGAAALVYHFRTDSRWAALGTGLMFGLAMNWNLLMAAVPLFAAGIALSSRLRRTPRPAGAASNLLLFVGGAIVPLAIMALSLRDIMPEAARALTLGTLAHGKSMPMHWLRDIHHCWGMATKAVHTLLTSGNPIPLAVDGGQLLSVAAAFVLPLVVGLALAGNWRSEWLGQRRESVTFLALWSALALPKFAARAGMGNLGYALCPLFILLATMLMVASVEGTKSSGSRLSRVTLLVVAAALFLSVPIVWAQTGREMLRKHFTVTAPYGQLWLSDAAEAQTWQGVIDLITHHSNERDYIFVTLWEAPPLYALTGRRNPTRYDSMIDVMAMPSIDKQRGIINDLSSHHTAVLVHDPDFCFDQRPDLVFTQACPLLQKALTEQFQFVTSAVKPQLALAKSVD